MSLASQCLHLGKDGPSHWLPDASAPFLLSRLENMAMEIHWHTQHLWRHGSVGNPFGGHTAQARSNLQFKQMYSQKPGPQLFERQKEHLGYVSAQMD